MKKILSFIIILSLVFLFAGCDSVITDNTSGDISDYTVDYDDAATFETDLVNETQTKGKFIQFIVKEYAPDSALGINCHAGEHLNFIFEEEIDVNQGDTVVVRITEEPTKIFLLGSWKIPCEFIELVSKSQDNGIDEKSADMAETPDTWTNLLEKHCEDVKKLFEDAGFTNIACVAREIEYNENNIFEGSVVNIAIGENGEIRTFEKGEQWEKNIKIQIDYRVKPMKTEAPEIKKTDDSSQAQTNDGDSTEDPGKTAQNNVESSEDNKTGASSQTQTNGDNSTEKSGVTVPNKEETKGNLVWVPTNGGTKYHSKSSCSGMKNPMQVSLETAVSNGYTPCARCY